MKRTLVLRIKLVSYTRLRVIEIEMNRLLYIIQVFVVTKKRVINMTVLHIGIQIKFPQLIFNLTKKVEIGFVGVIARVLIVRWYIGALLGPFNIVIMCSFKFIISTTECKI